MRAAVVFVAALVLGAAVPEALGTHPSRTQLVRANLDGDPARERLEIRESVSSDHSRMSASVTLVDRCRGVTRRYLLGRAPVERATVTVTEADGATPRREVFLWLRDVPATRGLAKVVRLTHRAGRCPVPVALFTYVPAEIVTSYSVSVADAVAEWRGKEVVLAERFGDALSRCFATFRYSPPDRRYVRARFVCTQDTV